MMAAALFVACSNGSDDGPSYTETLLIGTSYESESVKYSFDSGENFSGTKITASGKTPFKWVATDDGTVSIKFEDGTEETWTYDYTAQTISNESGTFNKLLDFAKFSITPSITTIKYDESIELAIDISPSDGVTYDINGGDDFGVQIENGKLKVQGIVTGEAVMQVTAKKPGYNDKTATAKVTVNGNDSMTLSISPATETVWLEDSKEFTLTTNQTSGVTYDINVTSGAETVEANIESGKLKVTGKKSGAAVVQVTAKKAGYNDKSVTVNLTVKGRDFSSFSVTPATQSVNWGQSINLTAAANPSDGVSYTAEVIGGDGSETVNVSGGNVTVSNLPVGDVTVKVTAQKSGYNDANREAKITVNPLNFTSLAITPETTTIKVGANLTLTASANPSDGVSYTARVTSGSSNADVQVTGSTITVTGRSAGEVTIEVTAKKTGYNDKTVTKTFTVENNMFTKFSIAPVLILTGKSQDLVIDIEPKDGVTYTEKISNTDKNNISATVSGSKVTVQGLYASGSTAFVTVTASKAGYENKLVRVAVKVVASPSVGNIIMKDGSLREAASFTDATDAEKKDAIAVVYKVDTAKKTAWIVGKKNGDNKEWCIYDVNGYNSSSNLNTEIKNNDSNNITFKGDYNDSSTGLSILKQAVNDYNATNYPAWWWCENYGKDTTNVPSDAKSEFKTGWCLPTIAELYDIWKAHSAITTVLTAVGGDRFSDYHWSSSQVYGKYNDYGVLIFNFAYKLNLDTGILDSNSKIDKMNVCAVRKFTY